MAARRQPLSKLTIDVTHNITRSLKMEHALYSDCNSGANSPSCLELAHYHEQRGTRRFVSLADQPSPRSPVASVAFKFPSPPLDRQDSGFAQERTGVTPIMDKMTLISSDHRPRPKSRSKRPSSARSSSANLGFERFANDMGPESPCKRKSCHQFEYPQTCHSPVNFGGSFSLSPGQKLTSSRSNEDLRHASSSVSTPASRLSRSMSHPVKLSTFRNASAPFRSCYQVEEELLDYPCPTLSRPAPVFDEDRSSDSPPSVCSPVVVEVEECTKDRQLPWVTGSKGRFYLLPKQLERLMKGQAAGLYDEVIIIDCRYPFEYENGHIQGAVNCWKPQQAIDYLMNRIQTAEDLKRAKRTAVVFYCEFSSERAPAQSRNFRNFEHEVFAEHHPDPPTTYAECYHETYVLRGGYKRFYGQYSELCTEQGYLPMETSGYEAILGQCKREADNAVSDSMWRQPTAHACMIRDKLMATHALSLL